jgi:nucleotide-binding universal stress UspA family protein
VSKTILCATDLSSKSAPALTAAAALADRFEAPAIWLLHAIDIAHGPTGYDGPETLDEQLEKEIAKLSSITSSSVQSMALYGDAPNALREFANRHAADLLVVASKGHGDTPLRRIGGMSEALSELSSTPLLVVRDDAPFVAWRDAKRPLRIVCGASHGQSWLAGLEWARKLRRAGPCDITIAQVYYAGEERERLGLAPGHSLTGSDAEVEAQLTRELEARVGKLEGRGETTIRLMAGIGRIGDHLLDVAKSEATDLIIVGDNHHRGLGRLSSVASVTLHYAATSVLLVPGELALPLPVAEPRRALVATDLEPVSNRALAHAYAILPASGQVTLLHVARDPEADIPAIRKALQALVPAFRERQTKIEIIQSLDVAPAICAAAERDDVDVLCLVSSRRLTRALGSIPDKVIRHTARPVLLVSGNPAK